MNPKLKSYLTIIIFLVIGMLIMGTASLIKTPDWLHSAFVVLLLFIIMNIAAAKLLGLKTDILRYWSVRKIYFLPIGIAAGGIIAATPVLAVLVTGAASINEVQFDTALTPASVMVTLAIVAWEELWFRGIFLNYCSRNLSAIHISLTLGLLFMLMHVLNPEIDLLQTGPTLFFAGALLTVVYFYFKSIWLPIGLHFGNNYLAIQSNVENHWLFGNEGYFGAVVLACLYLIFVQLTLKKSRNKQSGYYAGNG